MTVIEDFTSESSFQFVFELRKEFFPAFNKAFGLEGWQVVGRTEASLIDPMKKLDLSHNQIRELPDDVGKMEIKELELNHNPIRELPYFKHYERNVFDLSHTDLDYPMFWRQGFDWLKNIRTLVVPDNWDMEMLDAARRLMDFPKLGIYTYSEYQEYTGHF